MSTTLKDQARAWGCALACARHNITPQYAEFLKAANDTFEDTEHPFYGAFERTVSNLAAELYKQAGKELTVECQLFEQLSKAASWRPALNRFIDPVLETLAAGHARALQENQKLVKDASALSMLPLAMNSDVPVRRGLGALMTLAAITGAGLGTGYWALNRHATRDDDDIEEMKAKTQHYKEITNEISQRLKNNHAVDIA